MALVDLHVHSEHSEHPADWFLQRIGAAESYTDPFYVYQTAKERGMTFVTITDHNRISGSLLLKEKYPADVFTGVESTVYFPEDGCKVHILVYDLTQKQFDEIQAIRKDIYAFRDFVISEKLPYSVAHATYSVNKRLNITHVERLLLLFDVFEGVNGGRNFYNNSVWMRCITNLTSDQISDLYTKYHIEPVSADPWIKGITGGSDDHAGFFIGQTFTRGEANSPAEFLAQLKAKKTFAEGRHNDYKGLAFTIYKIAYDYSKQKSSGIANPLFKEITSNFFERKAPPKLSRFNLYAIFNKKKIAEDPIKEKVYALLDTIEKSKQSDIDTQFGLIYSGITGIVDTLFLEFVRKILLNVDKGDFFNLLNSFTGILPSVFLSLPFFSTLRVMYDNRPLLNQIKRDFGIDNDIEKKILWFTDTYDDLNGVSFTLKNIIATAKKMDKNIKLITCVSNIEPADEQTVINLASIYSFSLPHYESYQMMIPSLLHTIEKLSSLRPTEIYISTPGPIGLVGLLLAKLLNVQVTGVYHTDFTMQYRAIDEDASAAETVEMYVKWFYESMDQTLVPTMAYKQILVDRSYNGGKIGLIHKGIEHDVFTYKHDSNVLKTRYNIPAGNNLLFSGRISKDKNIDFIVDLVANLSKSRPVNLIIAGDGPYLQTLKDKTKGVKNVYLLGKIDRNDLAQLYSECDMFVFPSSTDTFGMVVLEALACGLPCIVTDVGGPQELISETETGFICPIYDTAKWEKCINQIIDMRNQSPDEYIKWRENISQRTLAVYSWEKVIDIICGW